MNTSMSLSLGTPLFLVNSTKIPTQKSKGKFSGACSAVNTSMKPVRYSCNKRLVSAASTSLDNLSDQISSEFAVEPPPPHHHHQLMIQDNEQYNYQFEVLVKRIKKTIKIMASKSTEINTNNHVQVLVMIDAIQRLDLEYYFRDEIHEALQMHYVRLSTVAEADGGSINLHDVALGFRLLRQEGFHVSPDTFKKFKDKNGKFKKELVQDTKGLLSLFEATHLSIPGDDILDEAADFSMNLLKNTLSMAEENMETAMIRNTLSNPSQKSLPRLVGVSAKNQQINSKTLLTFLHDCCGTQQWLKDVQDLAIIDISVSQNTLQDELTQLSRWSKEICMTEEVLGLARNQPLKWHVWSSNMIRGPYKSELRIELTKSILFIYNIDDLFDAYGNIEELTLFTKAVNRWEFENINGLPDYMKICLKALYDTTNDMSYKFYMKHGCNRKDCLQKAWAELCNAYLVEARWFNSGYMPTIKEYLENRIVSSGVYVVSATLFCLLGEGADNYKGTNDNVCNNHPNIVTLVATLLRLWDDLGSTKGEIEVGHDGSIVACYMNEHRGSSDESAREYVCGLISDAWKRLNEECLSHSKYSVEFKIAFLNLARMLPIMYKIDDNNHLRCLEKHMNTLLCD